MPKYEVKGKFVKGPGIAPVHASWRGEAASESDALSKAKKYLQDTNPSRIKQGFILESLVAKEQ